MTSKLPIRRVVLYKHGVGYFERKGQVQGDEVVNLDFKARDMNDVLKSMTVLDLSGGSVSAVSYDSTKPLEKLLEEATIRIPESGSVSALLGQVKGARVKARVGTSWVEGVIVGLETVQVAAGETSIERAHLALLSDGTLRTYDLMDLKEITFLDETVRKDLEFYLTTVLSSYKKDTKRVAILTSGEGTREIFVSYTLESPVWKTSYRILLAKDEKPFLQGWAVVDNTGDEDWLDAELALVAGLPISFVHDLYQPRYMRRPVVEVKREAAAAPIIPEEGFGAAAAEDDVMLDAALSEEEEHIGGESPKRAKAAFRARAAPAPAAAMPAAVRREAMERTAAVKTVVQEIGDLFEYRVENPVTVHRNQSALVPILHRPFEGRRVLLWNRSAREKNPMACIEFKNTTGLTLEGGPVTVTEEDHYVGEAMLDTLKPDDRRFVPFAVELSCTVSSEQDHSDGPVFRVQLSRGVLRAEYYNHRKTVYRIRNKAKRPQTLYLEHPREAGWDLVDTAKPEETTDNYLRFKQELSPGGEATLEVSERTPGVNQIAFNDAGWDQISHYLRIGYLDEKVAKELGEVAKLRERWTQLAQDDRRLNDERGKLHKDQERIRANMGALKGGGEQKELVDRFVTKLNQQEDRLEEIARKLEAIEEERKRLYAEQQERLNALTFEKELGEKAR